MAPCFHFWFTMGDLNPNSNHGNADTSYLCTEVLTF